MKVSPYMLHTWILVQNIVRANVFPFTGGAVYRWYSRR